MKSISIAMSVAEFSAQGEQMAFGATDQCQNLRGPSMVIVTCKRSGGLPYVMMCLSRSTRPEQFGDLRAQGSLLCGTVDVTRASLVLTRMSHGPRLS